MLLVFLLLLSIVSAGKQPKLEVCIKVQSVYGSDTLEFIQVVESHATEVPPSWGIVRPDIDGCQILILDGYYCGSRVCLSIPTTNNEYEHLPLLGLLNAPNGEEWVASHMWCVYVDMGERNFEPSVEFSEVLRLLPESLLQTMLAGTLCLGVVTHNVRVFVCIRFDTSALSRRFGKCH